MANKNDPSLAYNIANGITGHTWRDEYVEPDSLTVGKAWGISIGVYDMTRRLEWCEEVLQNIDAAWRLNDNDGAAKRYAKDVDSILKAFGTGIPE